MVKLLAPLKKQEKVIFNIKNKYNGDYSRVSDIARNTIIVNPEDAPKVFRELQKESLTTPFLVNL